MAWTLNTDGGSRGNPGPAAAAFVVRREDKVVLEAGYLLGRQTNNIAEYYGVLLGLQAVAAASTEEDLLVLSDSELVVRQITGEYQVKNAEIAAILEQVHKVIWKFECPPTFRHVARNQNKRADELVNMVLDGTRDVVACNVLGVSLPAAVVDAPPVQAQAGWAALARPSGPRGEAQGEGGGGSSRGRQRSQAGDAGPTAPAQRPLLAEGLCPVQARCVEIPGPGGCPAGLQAGRTFLLGHTVPEGFCVHAAPSVLKAVSSLVQSPIPEGERPEDFSAVTIRCPRAECQASFRVGYEGA